MNKLATLALWVMCLMALLSLSTAAYQDYSQSNKQYQQKSYNNDPIKCNPNVRYADGFCNNPWNPFWGWTGDLLLRKEGVQYTDGLWEPVYRGNERTISNMFFADEYYDKNPETQPYDIKKKRDGPHAHEHNLNNLHIIFGQLLTHDIGWFPAEHVRSSVTWKRHAPYKIPLVDHYDVLRESNKGKSELMVSPGEGAWIDDRFYPWNNSTAFIDCSPIYGSTEEVAMKLRLRKDGKLIGSDKKTHRGLPHLSQVKVHNDCSNTSPTGHAAGDVRVNENIGLTALHTIFHDEHNRICDDIISKVGRGKWSDEKIYQEARRIVIALMQRITMEEFLPLLLINPHNKDSEKIIREAIGSYKGYNRWVHPGIMNAFASSAFRVSHDLINLPLLVLDNKCNVIPSPEINVGGAQRDQPYMQSSSSRYPIYAQNSDDKSYSDNRDYEKQPYLGERTMCIPEHFDKVPGGVSSIFRGLINQMAQKQDSKIANYLRNVRTGTYSGVGNLDIEALHVYRGRLHGLPDYNTLRKYFGGKDLRSEKNCGRGENGNDSLECFMGVTKNKETARKLQKFYRSCDNIDAFVGMVIEDKEDWSSLPPTTTRIIITQFKNLRDGDRFWYENRESKLFAEEEIKGIKKTSLADIIRRNTNGLYDDEIPRDIFHVPSKSKCFSKY